MIKTYVKCKGCGREYRCATARDLIHCVYCGEEGTSKIMSNEEKKEPLLTIELQDETSVPKVFYKGKEITNKVNVMFEWDTSDSCNPCGLTYAIEHFETGNKQLTSNRIERRCGYHA